MTLTRFATAALLAFAAAGAAPVLADAIDGDWCQAEKLRLSIDGSNIITPGGKKTTGDYTRHSFVYVAPAADMAAGQTVAMTLMNEETMQLRTGASAAAAVQGPMQIWRRCAAPVS